MISRLSSNCANGNRSQSILWTMPGLENSKKPTETAQRSKDTELDDDIRRQIMIDDWLKACDTMNNKYWDKLKIKTDDGESSTNGYITFDRNKIPYQLDRCGC